MPPALNADYRPVIFVPGMTGSSLKQGNDVVWGNVEALISDPHVLRNLNHNLNRLRLPGPSTRVGEVIEEFVPAPTLAPFFKQVKYRSILDHLRDNLGYTVDQNLFLFPYDWRQDCARNAAKLQDFIRSKQRTVHGAKFTILAHSLGGLIARYCVQVLRGDSNVQRVIVMGTPSLGAPEAFEDLMKGAKLPLWPWRVHPTLAVIRTFPSAYQLLPIRGFYMEDGEGRPADLKYSQNHDWLDRNERDLMDRAVTFHKDLDQGSQHVPVYSIYGFGRHTSYRVKACGTQPGMRWIRAEYSSNDAGDGVVPEDSAKYWPTYVHPVAREHGDLFNDPSARKYIEDLLGGAAPALPTRYGAPNVVLYFQESAHRPSSIARYVFGVKDAAGRIVRDAEFDLKLWPETPDPSGLPLHQEHLTTTNATGQARLEQGTLTVPADRGGYFVEVEARLPDGSILGTGIDYFVVQ